MPYLFVAVLLLLSLGAWWVVRLVRSITAESVKREAENARGWQELARTLSAAQSDVANRVLIRSGVPPAPKDDPERVVPAEIAHEESNDEWAKADEQQEIEEKAREALRYPHMEMLYEDAAMYDADKRKVHEKILELKRQQPN